MPAWSHAIVAWLVLGLRDQGLGDCFDVDQEG